MSQSRPRRVLRVVVDELFWTEDMAHATPAGRTAAGAERRRLERDGIALADLRRCDDDHRDGTRLAGCAKLYVPPPVGPWGIVVRGARDEAGPVLAVLAFGLRHPPQGNRRPSVYRVAHDRLHE